MIKSVRLIALVLAISILTSVVLFAETFTYDELGRLVQIECESGTITTFTHDANGNITGVTIVNSNTDNTTNDNTNDNNGGTDDNDNNGSTGDDDDGNGGNDGDTDDSDDGIGGNDGSTSVGDGGIGGNDVGTVGGGTSSGREVQSAQPGRPPTQQTTPDPVHAEDTMISLEESENGLIAVVVSSHLTSFSPPLVISVEIGALAEGLNPYRIVAVSENGVIIGGRLDIETGLFVFEVVQAGRYEIVYMENLNRLIVQIGEFTIHDLAGNAETVTMDVVPIIQNGRTLLPLRFIANALGAEVDWNESERQVTLTQNDRVLVLSIDIITPELSALGMDVPPVIINDRTMVPLRFISEYFGAVVIWHEDTRTVEIIYG